MRGDRIAGWRGGAQAALFDLDGVLVDSRVPFARCVNAALEAHGLPTRPEADLHRFIGPPLSATFGELTGGDDALVGHCVRAYRARYVEHAVAETPVFGGIREALAELAARMPLVVATSKSRPLADALLRGLGLRRHFTAVVGPALDALHESKPETVARALRELPGRAPVAMVGDRRFDMLAARAHGLCGIAVAWGIGSEEELWEAGADVLAQTPAELVWLIARANGGAESAR